MATAIEALQNAERNLGEIAEQMPQIVRFVPFIYARNQVSNALRWIQEGRDPNQDMGI